MKVRYDENADAGYMYLTDQTDKIAETKEISDEIFVDYDDSGQPIGIEILGLKDKVPSKALKFFKTQSHTSSNLIANS